MIIYGENHKQKLIDDYRVKANYAGEEIFEALVTAEEWPTSGPDAGRKTIEQAEESISHLISRVEFITDKLSKDRANEIAIVLSRFVSLAATHPELLPEMRADIAMLKRWK
jgi:hypothetical protein